jgi:hypothetical protein
MSKSLIPPNVTKINFTKLRCEINEFNSSFPQDFLTQEQKESGLVIVHIIIAFYAIILSEHVFDKYFMPSLEYLTFEKLNFSLPVAGSTILGKLGFGFENFLKY